MGEHGMNIKDDGNLQRLTRSALHSLHGCKPNQNSYSLLHKSVKASTFILGRSVTPVTPARNADAQPLLEPFREGRVAAAQHPELAVANDERATLNVAVSSTECTLNVKSLEEESHVLPSYGKLAVHQK